MHQQIRTRLGTAGVDDGTGAMSQVPEEIDPLLLRPGALVELLELLDDNGFDLELAGGEDIELGGEFAFALKEHDRTGDCATLLRDSGYRGVRIIRVQSLEVEDRKGGLLDALRKLSEAGLRIDDLHVGVKRDDGIVPVQVTTITDVETNQVS